MLKKLHTLNIFDKLSLSFARFIYQREQNSNLKNLMALTAAIVSSEVMKGSICVFLSEYAEKILDAEIILPTISKWNEILKNAFTVGSGSDYKPLIFDGEKIYLQKYYFYETYISSKLKEMIVCRNDKNSFDLLKDYKSDIDKLFGVNTIPNEINWQKIAFLSSLVHNFSVISGGPGTGKTSTLAKILLLYKKIFPASKIALVAPTGKAALRMNESLLNAKKNIDFDQIEKDQISLLQAMTIHKLLGFQKKSNLFRYNDSNKLPYDLIVVDEVSMLDIAMAAKFLSALKPNVKLIFLGDKNQLASVEAGSVMGDICDATELNRFSQEFISNCEYFLDTDNFKFFKKNYAGKYKYDYLVNLEKSYRFNSSSKLGIVVSEIVKRYPDRKIIEGNLNKGNLVLRKQKYVFKQEIKEEIIAGYREYIEANDISTALEYFNKFRVLTALRDGEYGAKGLNEVIQNILKEAGLINFKRNNDIYENIPIMITGNDYVNNLFNGDIGIVRKNSNGVLRCFFQANNDIGYNEISPLLLKYYEAVYAMTVHKSQGSEFNKGIFILPKNDMPLLSKELVFTALSRVKESIVVIGDEDIFYNAVKRKAKRKSGLMMRLKDFLEVNHC